MNTRMRTVLTVLVCLGLLAGWPVLPVLAAGVITTSADKTMVDGNERFTVSMNVDTTPNLFGVQLSLDYDSTRLTAIEVRAGDAWPVGNTFVARSTIMAASHSVEFAATLTSQGATVDTTKPLVTIIFEAINPTVQTTTAISNGITLPLILSNSAGQTISATPPSNLNITINPAPEVTGAVTLQSPGAGRQATINITSLTVQRNTQAASGVAFTLAVPTASNYTLTATASCHLSAQRTAVSAPSSGNNTTLRAGDVNGDNMINIQDLSAMGSRFNQSPGTLPCTDLDENSTVNILDLSRASSNFGATGPTAW